MSLERPHHLFSGIAEFFGKSASPKNTNQAKEKSASPFSIRLTAEERALLNERAGSQPLGTYIRSCLLDKETHKRRPVRRPGLDHKMLALMLSELGRSRLASNMNQLARAANMGKLDVSNEITSDLQEACQAIAHMRDILIAPLGRSRRADHDSGRQSAGPPSAGNICLPSA
ncbi:MAG: hypothetical protein ACU843_09180 [Gammaproteobacteria bacterium]